VWNSGFGPAWFLSKVGVVNTATGDAKTFNYNNWMVRCNCQKAQNARHKAHKARKMQLFFA
jgi:hypothetical protein